MSTSRVNVNKKKNGVIFLREVFPFAKCTFSLSKPQPNFDLRCIEDVVSLTAVALGDVQSTSVLPVHFAAKVFERVGCTDNKSQVSRYSLTNPKRTNQNISKASILKKQ